jgi:hypothetical protein
MYAFSLPRSGAGMIGRHALRAFTALIGYEPRGSALERAAR